jgi:hypothetical protein
MWMFFTDIAKAGYLNSFGLVLWIFDEVDMRKKAKKDFTKFGLAPILTLTDYSISTQ